MCGIIAYKGKRNGNEITVKGLKNLEYRGYDSYGFSWFKDGKIESLKRVGKIGEFKDFDMGFSNISLAHTRWATSSLVTENNAHPHLSQDKKIALVHNGIVENFQELRDFLAKEGYKLRTETDTEVIPYLIQYFMDKMHVHSTNKSFRSRNLYVLGRPKKFEWSSRGYPRIALDSDCATKRALTRNVLCTHDKKDDFKEATRQALLKVEGSFAVVAMHQDSSQMIAARRDSPLVLGVGKDEFFAASDVPAFLEWCNKVIYLDDDELATINDEIKVFDLNDDKEIKKEIKTITWTIEQAKKGNFPHYMLKEITEQKFTIKAAIEQKPELMEKVTDMINNAFGVFFVGCGTSYHACVSASYIFSHVAKKHINVVLASEFRNYEHFLTDKTLVIGVSQSGETADLLDAIKFARKHGCKTMSIVNVMGSTLTRLCEENIMMNSGPEICVLSTKSYTSQLAILLTLAYSVAGILEDGKRIIENVCKHVDKVIDDSLKNLKQVAEMFKEQHDLFLIGRDLAYPSALEGALKIKEVSYIHAEGFAGAELKHGTIALIDKGVPCICLTTNTTRQMILNNAMEIKSRGGYIIGIDNKENEVYDYFIKVPAAGDGDPILMILPVQVLAYYLALARGCDVDFPRNLAKCVSVR